MYFMSFFGYLYMVRKNFSTSVKIEEEIFVYEKDDAYTFHYSPIRYKPQDSRMRHLDNSVIFLVYFRVKNFQLP